MIMKASKNCNVFGIHCLIIQVFYNNISFDKQQMSKIFMLGKLMLKWNVLIGMNE